MSLQLKPTSIIKANLGIQPNGPVHAFFTNQCYKHMTKYVPYGVSEFHLRENVDVTTDRITYKAPYSHFIYMGILYVDPVTGSPWARKKAKKVPTNKKLRYHAPGTGKYWDKRMWTVEKNKVVEEVQNFLNRGGK